MEWVETTAKTVDEAKELALDRLGVAEEDAEFEIVDEPRPGLFGRLRGDARVRARVRPTRPRPKAERRDRRRSQPDRGGARREGGSNDPSNSSSDDPDLAGGEVDETLSATPRASSTRRRSSRARASASSSSGSDDAAPVEVVASSTADESTDSPTPARTANSQRRRRSNRTTDPSAHPVSPLSASTEPMMDESRTHESPDPAEVGAAAVSFLEGLVEAFGLSAEVSLHEVEDEMEVRVDGENLGLLVGPRGATLLAIQDVTRVASQRRLGDHQTRLRIDVAGYREKRREALSRFAHKLAEEVISTGEDRVLEPMPSADRKIIHDTLSTVDGVATRSEGDDPRRYVVIAPA